MAPKWVGWLLWLLLVCAVALAAFHDAFGRYLNQ